MSYDLYWKSPSATTLRRVRAARAALTRALTTTSNPDTLAKAEARVARASQYYYGCNNWTMGITRDLMMELGMLVEVPYPNDPTVARPEDEGFEEWWSEGGGDGGLESWTAYREAVLAYFESVPEKVEGISFFKLCSNDSWVVTPAECQAALLAWRRACDERGWGYNHVPETVHDEQPVRVDWWGEWLTYLSGATQAEGFVVG
jgi:hypothetical protein